METLGIPERKILFCDQHVSHAASAFYPSPFKNATIVTMDGVGEEATTTIGVGTENKIDVFKQIKFPHSIGLFYSAYTAYLGFEVNDGEYKVMGMAAFGKPLNSLAHPEIRKPYFSLKKPAGFHTLKN